MKKWRKVIIEGDKKGQEEAEGKTKLLEEDTTMRIRKEATTVTITEIIRIGIIKVIGSIKTIEITMIIEIGIIQIIGVEKGLKEVDTMMKMIDVIS